MTSNKKTLTKKKAAEDLEITPEELYLSRRKFMRNSAMLAAGAMMVAGCAPDSASDSSGISATSTPMDDDKVNSFEEISGYTNFYEFSEDKSGPTQLAKDFKSSPWTVRVDGLVSKPANFSMEEIKTEFPSEERIYRLRCVEGWSMVIPWLGFPLQKLLNEVQPTDQAKYVRFVTLLDPAQFPGQNKPSYPWPYVEGLRLDEAKHDLTILATGLYGKDLPPQNGSPIRLAVPWKYGFKSIKSIVRIELVAEEPQSLWMKLWPEAYGFYANVNPDVPHPRWSQASEIRIGDNRRRKTLMFNGYEEQVAHLYKGMDLTINY